MVMSLLFTGLQGMFNPSEIIQYCDNFQQLDLVLWKLSANHCAVLQDVTTQMAGKGLLEQLTSSVLHVNANTLNNKL